ncbi:MAG: fatty acid CoA ligase family protein [Desulfuromonadaceae bacterium]|nr:fatty acid CoA ligase family protein [Desulfuromonadaceae bacterium]MDD2848349.1 fatty acid CoA ligase family protein [Desulfuromonadaceae bacterium]MDD4129255.1 fatty acid CoA ligase family protein [Desulfuromonadaceae bacterium]
MKSSAVINISRPLTEMARLQPETAAIIFPQKGRTLSFRELDQESDRIAQGLVRIDIVRGTRVALLVPPSPELFSLTFALFKVGAVPVFIDPGIGVRNMKRCLEEAEPKAFIGIPKAHLARRLLGWGRASIRTTVVVGGGSYWGGIPLDELRRSAQATPFVAAETGCDEVAAILFTSGSTGPPKGAIYTHGTFAAQVETLRELYDIRPGEIDLPTFPLFALFAPALGMTALIPQMDFTRPGTVDPRRILGPAAEYSATTMFGSPALLNRVGRYAAKHSIKLPTLKRVISAGAPVPAAVLERFTALLPDDAEIFTPYGATEALPVSSIGSREVLGETGAMTGEGHGVCIGRPVSSITVAIIPISDTPVTAWSDSLALPPLEIGEITVRGPQVSTAYLNRPEATEMAKIPDPSGGVWHRMGDVGYRDKSGRIWFCGRKAHRVVTSEGPLFTIPVEGVFNTHPAVFRTALVGVGMPGSQQPVLCVELEKRSGKPEQEQIRMELREIGSHYPHTRDIRQILFHPAFPVDIRHNAKIFREKLAVWAKEKLS